MWTHTLTKTVSNFSPTSFTKSHRSMLKARRIPTSTAALKRRLVQDEGENIPPLTFFFYTTQAKDSISSSPARSLPAVRNSHWLQSITDMQSKYEKLKLDTKPTLFWKLKEERKNRHLMNISACDLCGRRGRCSSVWQLGEPRFLTVTHKHIQLIRSKGQPELKQREHVEGSFSVSHSWATSPHNNTSPRILVKHGEPH